MNEPKANLGDSLIPLAAMADLSIAYIKAFEMEGQPGYAVHTADGEMIGWCEDRATAFAAAAQHDLLAVSVH